MTNGGLGGQSLFSAFERITHLLANVIEYQDTFRCSTHMHVNMLDFTVPQVAKFLMVYAACEPYLFAHCGQYRRSSNFCVPVGDSLPFHKNLIANLYEDCVATRSGTRVTNKYTAMNLQPLFGSDRVRPIGTVEFRGGRPMTTMDDFLLQANLLLSIKEFVRRGPEDAEELLHLMGDTVTNSVYANGVAAGLNVQQAELEQATIDAWMLLKSYQQGMKRPRNKYKAGQIFGDEGIAAVSGGLPTQGFEWGNPGDVEPVAREPMPTVPEELSFWNSAVNGLPGSRYSGNRGTEQSARLNPFRSWWPRFDMYSANIGSDCNGRGFRDRWVSMACDSHLGRNALTVEEAYSVAIGWQLYNLEQSPLFALKRAVVAKVEGGRRQGILDGVRFDMQPGIKLEESGIGGFKWDSILPIEIATEVASWWGANYTMFSEEEDQDVARINWWSVFQGMLCKVRIKHMPELTAALQAKMDWLPMLKREMYATEMYHLLRIAELPSRDHIHREDLELFDKVQKTMSLLYGFGGAVPVLCYQRRSALGAAGQRYHIRLTRDPLTVLGLPVNTMTRETRTPRAGVEIGRSTLYIY